MNKLNKLVLVSGTSVPTLSGKIAAHLRTYYHRHVVKVEISKFSDNETSIEIMDSVRGRDAYIIQSTCDPANDNYMELFLLADALNRSSVKSTTAVIPYMGYSRQDRRPKFRRMPISASVMATMIQAVGIKHVVTVDIHAAQIQGMYRNKCPFINIGAASLFVADIYGKHNTDEIVIVAPDAGGVERARSVAKQLEADLAVIDKRRPKANEAEVMNILGDVEDKKCIIVDDMVDTASTLCKGVKALMDHGAREVYAYCTHPVLSGNAILNINISELKEMVVTDTICLGNKAESCKKLRVLSMASLLSETIRRIQVNDSVSSLYMMD